MRIRQRPYHQAGRWVACPACQRMHNPHQIPLPLVPLSIRCAYCCQNGPVRNARFWELIGDSWVKITLRPGQELSHNRHWRAEEGWAAAGTTWTHDADEGRVVSESWTDGADCDGRLSSETSCYCPLADLAGRNVYLGYPCPENVGIHAPLWEAGEHSQRDYQAESAGY